MRIERQATYCVALRSDLPRVMGLVMVGVTAYAMTGARLVAQSSDVAFGRDILPILSHNCFACHGPDEHARKAHLELHRRTAVLAKKILVPGNSAASEIIRRLLATDDDHMPPKKTGKTLTAGEIDLIRRWIDQGAKWGVHWSFEKVVRPPLPAVENRSWPKCDLDRFVLAKIEARGLTPSPPADRPALIRRLSLDLTGLPPTPAEVAAFARDERPDAYAKLADSLLQRPTYGEHWTRLWLDLARYADTKGYEKDRVRTIWPYRDWLIRSFNHDLPFDEFTRDQLAGDLVAKPTEDQLVATAFHRNTLANDEGGTDDEEFRVAAVKDRVDTTIQIWMGLSMGCAKCHSHKYDPISQREYYEFFAIFNQTQDADRADDAPTLPLPTAEQRRLLQRIDADIAAQRDVLNAETPELARAQAAWETAERNKASAESKLPKGIPEILQLAPETRTDAQRGELAQHFRHVTPLLDATRKAIRKLETQKRRNRPLRLPIMRELDAARHRKTHIHIRGSFLSKGDEVQPGVPAAFGPFPKGPPKNRLGVAQWLTDRANPLTARVTVNRWWAQFFGVGIVETQEDFGSQGATPSHPRLLDWLATEFVRQGYSMKRLCKTIVVSATYRQRSAVTKELLAMDPFNRLLARGPSYRMSAEMVRDNALAISGLLSHKLYGPPVMPPQPAGIWQSTYNSTNWQTSPGEDRWRRGIYTFVKRTSGYPSTLLFDAPTRETCTLRRIPTNTPLQALVTLNDPVFVEAAQAMARRLVREGGASVENRLRYGLRLAVARAPRVTEVSRLRRLYEHRLTYYRSNADSAADPRRTYLKSDASFANNCLLARRLVERGVRFVQLFDWGWDHHGSSPGESIDETLPIKCAQTDRAVAGLLLDLKQRGLLDDTLVIWGGEFGRTPMMQNNVRKKRVKGFIGRDHHSFAFTMWMAGGGIRGGQTIGATDHLGYYITERKIHVPDLQATILHLLGLDPHRLSYPFQGLDKRLIGPANSPRVVTELLA